VVVSEVVHVPPLSTPTAVIPVPLASDMQYVEFNGIQKTGFRRAPLGV